MLVIKKIGNFGAKNANDPKEIFKPSSTVLRTKKTVVAIVTE